MCLAFSSKQGIRVHVRSAYASSMWMQVCADTKIGNNMIRGVSGGQRKRVTTGHLPATVPHKAWGGCMQAQTADHWKRLP